MIRGEIIAALECLRDELSPEVDAGASLEVVQQAWTDREGALGWSREASSAVRSFAARGAEVLIESVAAGFDRREAADVYGLERDEDGTLVVDMRVLAATIWALAFEEGALSVLMLHRLQAEEAAARQAALREISDLPEADVDG